MTSNWAPSATLASLRQRATILAAIRDYFAEQDVLEVETPQLSRHGITDVYLQNLECVFQGPGYPEPLSLYLQTSPEYAMKRLLCAGSGSIYQIAKAFRDDESGRLHNPEFTLLEWYRVGFDHHQLMDDMQALLSQIVDWQFERISYQQAFQRWLEFDPLSAPLGQIQQIAATQGLGDMALTEQDRDFLLQWLFSERIEPRFAEQKAMFVFDFPASQAALARLSETDNRVAHRFELYYRGIELANGFFELADANEQRQRFEQDNERRIQLGKPPMPLDEALLTALSHGLPSCAGVAMGIDRLVMLALQKQHIDEVVAFPLSRA